MIRSPVILVAVFAEETGGGSGSLVPAGSPRSPRSSTFSLLSGLLDSPGF